MFEEPVLGQCPALGGVVSPLGDEPPDVGDQPLADAIGVRSLGVKVGRDVRGRGR
jgi:hypothetical protein